MSILLKHNGDDYRWNTDRIAEIWLDEYIRYYYRTVGDTKNRNFGDITERLEIKKRIGCKPFDWYIKNVYPKVPIPEEIRDPTTTTPPPPPAEEIKEDQQENDNKNEA